jgi:hypothetical protein
LKDLAEKDKEIIERKKQTIQKTKEPSQKEKVLKKAASVAQQKKDSTQRNALSLLQPTEAYTSRVLTKDDSQNWGLMETGKRATPSWRSGV